MIDCVAIGDTIALNLSPKPCIESRASSELISSRIIAIAPGSYHEVCVISAGSYDPAYNIEHNLQSIRNQSICKFYVWIKPINPNMAKQVIDVAQKNNDKVISFAPGSDNITPSSYTDLSNSIINQTNN